MTPAEVAGQLHQARHGGPDVDWRAIWPKDRDEAYAIQDATLARTGPVGGWKVGARSPEVEPHCAPLPASNLLSTGAKLTGPAWRLRGVEVELGFRVARNLHSHWRPSAAEELIGAFDAVLPLIEVVETRLDDWAGSDPLAKLADLQGHGALVCGAPIALDGVFDRTLLDLRTVQASLEFDGVLMASTRGGNPAADWSRMLRWLIAHSAQRGAPLQAGAIVATGSCTELLYAPAGCQVQAELFGLGKVDVRF